MSLECLTFSLGSTLYAIDVFSIQEVISYTKPCDLPCPDPIIAGVIASRGKDISVVNLRRKFRLKERENDKSSRIIVLDAVSKKDGSTVQYGVIVDSVHEVVAIDEKDMADPPDVGNSISKRFIKKVARLRGDFTMILDVDSIFTFDELERLSKAQRATPPASPSASSSDVDVSCVAGGGEPIKACEGNSLVAPDNEGAGEMGAGSKEGNALNSKPLVDIGAVDKKSSGVEGGDNVTLEGDVAVEGSGGSMVSSEAGTVRVAAVSEESVETKSANSRSTGVNGSGGKNDEPRNTDDSGVVASVISRALDAPRSTKSIAVEDSGNFVVSGEAEGESLSNTNDKAHSVAAGEKRADIECAKPRSSGACDVGGKDVVACDVGVASGVSSYAAVDGGDHVALSEIDTARVAAAGERAFGGESVRHNSVEAKDAGTLSPTPRAGFEGYVLASEEPLAKIEADGSEIADAAPVPLDEKSAGCQAPYNVGEEAAGSEGIKPCSTDANVAGDSSFVSRALSCVADSTLSDAAGDATHPSAKPSAEVEVTPCDGGAVPASKEKGEASSQDPYDAASVNPLGRESDKPYTATALGSGEPCNAGDNDAEGAKPRGTEAGVNGVAGSGNPCDGVADSAFSGEGSGEPLTEVKGVKSDSCPHMAPIALKNVKEEVDEDEATLTLAPQGEVDAEAKDAVPSPSAFYAGSSDSGVEVDADVAKIKSAGATLVPQGDRVGDVSDAPQDKDVPWEKVAAEWERDEGEESEEGEGEKR